MALACDSNESEGTEIMCGIVGYVGKRNCTDVLINGLSKLEYRGYDSAGIAVFQDGKIAVAKCKGRLKDLEDKMEREGRPEGNVGIGHTRWATHGEPSDVNSHPHSGGRVTIVHNGIIENYKELKDHLASKGVTFASDTDTEVVAKLLDYRYNGSPIQTISDVIRDLEGSYALGIIFADHPDQVYAVRCESPLIVGVGKGESFIASDVPAIIEYTRDYYLLEHEEIAVLGSDGVHIYDAFGQPVEKELKTADWGCGGDRQERLCPLHAQGDPRAAHCHPEHHPAENPGRLAQSGRVRHHTGDAAQFPAYPGGCLRYCHARRNGGQICD